MEVRTTANGNKALLKISGELDHATAGVLKEKMDKLISSGVIEFTLDLSNLTFMDSSGIGVIIGRYKKIASKKGSIAVKNEGRTIKKIFEISGLYKIVKRA